MAQAARAAAFVAAAILLAGSLLAAILFHAVTVSAQQQRLYATIVTAQRDELIQLVDEETGVRGYVATGDPLFLSIYYDSRAPLRSALDAMATAAQPFLWMRPLMQRNAAARERVERYLQREIALMRSGRRRDALANLSRGRELFDEFRATNGALGRTSSLELNRQRTTTFSLARTGSLASVLFCVAVFVLFAAFLAVSARSRAFEASSYRDSLTGAGNRRSALRLLRRLVSRHPAQAFGIVFIDLDGFKKINDVYGHAAGDAILKAVASRLQAELREGDHVCRLGGDEFVCIIAAPQNIEALEPIAQRLRKAAGRHYSVGDEVYVVGCSVGVSVFPQDGDTAEALLQRADKAMYAAKSRGGGVQFSKQS